VNLLETNAVDIDQVPVAAFDYNETEAGVDDHGFQDELEEIEAESYEQSQTKMRKARDRRTTRSWKIKFSSMHGVRCLLMHARVLLKPPRGIGKGSKINTSA
jgi:hypothetical protein